MDSETRIRTHCKAVDAFEAKNSGVVFDCYMDMEQEVKRLQLVNAALLEALRWAAGCDYARGGTIGQVYIVRQAIAKAEGKTE